MELKFLSKFRIDYNLLDLKEKYGSDNVFVFPCCKCESCRRNYAEEWSIRCALEAKEHKYNYFITLTYDDYHVGYATDSDLKKFLDRLEGRKHKNKFKYFACRELGATTSRVHYHIAIFADFELDLKEPQWISGFYYYHSDMISKTWKFGFHNVAPFESSCARYIAKYTSKSDSKIFMSRNIGKSYFERHLLEIIDDNFILYGDFGNKKHIQMPAVFVRWFSEMDLAKIEDFKDRKKKLAHLVECYSLRNLQSIHEEDVIHNDQMNIKTETRRKL